MYSKNIRYQEDLREAAGLIPQLEGLFGKTFLISGASGLIASFLVDLLFFLNETEKADIKVYAVVRDKGYAAKRYQSIIENPKFNLVIQDFSFPLSSELVHLLKNKVDYVIHAAGDGYPGAFREHPVETMMPALIGTNQLLECIKGVEDMRFLYVSSGEIYGSDITGEFMETDSGYVDSMKSRSCYPSAKRAAETLCASYVTEYGVDAVVVRPSHVYGPNFSKKDNRASAQFFQNVLIGQDVVLNSMGKQLRSYTYVADCVSAMLAVLLKGNAGEAYNLSNPDAKTTIAEFAQLTAMLGGRKCLFKDPGAKELEESTPIACAVLNSDKLHGLGWRGAYDVERGIRHTLQILKNQSEIDMG